jgi:hypothetical protein
MVTAGHKVGGKLNMIARDKGKTTEDKERT